MGAAVIGLLIELRLPGLPWRLFGWTSAPAALRGHTGSGSAALAFADRDVQRGTAGNAPMNRW